MTTGEAITYAIKHTEVRIYKGEEKVNRNYNNSAAKARLEIDRVTLDALRAYQKEVE